MSDLFGFFFVFALADNKPGFCWCKYHLKTDTWYQIRGTINDSRGYLTKIQHINLYCDILRQRRVCSGLMWISRISVVAWSRIIVEKTYCKTWMGIKSGGDRWYVVERICYRFTYLCNKNPFVLVIDYGNEYFSSRVLLVFHRIFI